MEQTDTAATEDYRARVLLVDNGVRLLCRAQQADGTADAGGFRCPERLCCEPLYTAFALSTLWQCYREPLSHFHQDPEIQNRMFAALAFLRRAQRDDGGLDFYAAGDANGAGTTARALNSLGRDYDTMADGPDAMPADFLTSLGEFLRGGGRALVYGPAAPGDRLEVATALMRLHGLWPDPQFVACAWTYIAEGADINEDGMFAARSAAEALAADEALLQLAALTGDETLLDPVRRSLDFLLCNVHENGEVVYQYAARPEAVTPRAKAGGAAVWAAMAGHDRDGRYAHMADRAAIPPITVAEAARRCQSENDAWTATIDNDDLHPQSPQGALLESLSRRGALLETRPAPPEDLPRETLPERYCQTFRQSALVRARDGKRSVTLMAMQPSFLSLHNRGVVLEGLRVAYNDDGWRLIRPAGFEEYGGYLYRFRSADGGLRVVITAEVRAEAVSLVVEVQGPPRVPVQIEMAWRPEGVLETGDGRRYALAGARRAVVTDQDFAVAGGADRVTVTGLPPMTQRYFDDTLPWMPSVPVVRVLSPFFSPATARLEMTLQ